MSRPQVPVDWRSVDTLLLDMDGTVLDLSFDNHFWLVVVPSAYAERRGMEAQHAWPELKRRYDRVAGRLQWYCVDYWSRELGLDIPELKHAHRHLIGYLPGAIAFLELARELGKQLAIVTNAHPAVLDLKLRQTRLDKFVGTIVSSHRFGMAKEDPRFWSRLARDLAYSAKRTLVIEDSAAVARTATARGLATLLVRRPDSRQPPRELTTQAAIDGLGDLLPTLR